MPKTKREKEKIIQEIKEKLKQQKSLVFLNITGLKTEDLFNLRQRVKKEGGEVRVIKKTLFAIALRSLLNLNIGKKELPGQLAVVFGFKDEISPIKAVYEFIKEHKNCEIVGGLFEKVLRKKEEMEQIALLPGKPELLAKLVLSLETPIFNFVSILKENLRRFLFLLSNLKVQTSK